MNAIDDMRMRAVQPMPMIPIKESLILEAANLYSTVMLVARRHENQEFIEAAQSLQARLGEAQVDLDCEEDTLMFGEIQKISKFLRRLNKHK